MLVCEEDSIVIYGLSKPFEEDYRKVDKSELISLWYREIDILYFSKTSYLVILSKVDEEILRKSKCCYDKLRVLSFKKNVKIMRCYNFTF